MKFFTRYLWIIILIAMFPGNVNAQTTTPVELAFLVDGSGSITSSDFSIMLNGIADALVNPKCVPHNGTLELTVIQFGSGATVEVAPKLINSLTDAQNVASVIRNIVKDDGGTDYEAGFDLAIATVRFALSRQLINITTDGAPNSESGAIAARQRALNAGFDEIDAEGIGLSVANGRSAPTTNDPAVVNDPISFLRDNIVYPQPGLLSPPATWPPNKAGWVRLVNDANAFAATVCEKFQIVVSAETATPTVTPVPVAPVPVPEPITIVLFGTGLAGLATYAQRRKRGFKPTDSQ